MADYTPPITLGTVEIDTTPDHDGDLEIYTPDGDHFAYLRTGDQIVLRDMLNKLHPQTDPAPENDIQRSMRIAAETHRDLPNDTDVAVVFAEFKRRLGQAEPAPDPAAVLDALVADLLIIANDKADWSTKAGRWWAHVITSTVEKHTGRTQ
jgi:hypothetical protein